ncbi:MAG: hypothetical protein KA761_00320 [Gemmatimonadaceae bacterium]|nr:hypothetical protein [Gemmatimonadaceae bacterium]
MWISFNDGFISIVDKHAAQRKALRPGDTLEVRARHRTHLSRLFPEATIISHAGTDYPVRVRVTRERVAALLVGRVMGIDYSNFKDSVKEARLKAAYSRVWGVMHGVADPERDPRQGRLDAYDWNYSERLGEADARRANEVAKRALYAQSGAAKNSATYPAKAGAIVGAREALRRMRAAGVDDVTPGDAPPPSTPSATKTSASGSPKGVRSRGSRSRGRPA